MTGYYTAALSSFLKADIDLINDTISVLLVNSALYTVDLASHESQEDIADAAVWATATLSGKTIVDGVFHADDLVFTNVSGTVEGDTANALVVVLNTETYSGSLLIAYIDSPPEFPIELDGESVTVSWDPTYGVFRL